MEHAGDGTGSDTLELSGSLDVRRTAELRVQVYGLLPPAPVTSSSTSARSSPST